MKRSITRRSGVLFLVGALAIGVALAWRATRRVPRSILVSESPAAVSPDKALTTPFGLAPAANGKSHGPADSGASLPASLGDREVFQRGTTALEAGRTADAIRDLEQIVERNPRLPIARGYLGLAYVREKRFADALRQFNEERRLLPNPAFALAHIADVHYAKGDLPLAIKSLEEASSHSPNLAQVHLNLGILYPQALQLGKGLAALGRYLDLEPGNHYAHYLRGNLEYKLARLDEAESSLSEAIRLSPQTGLYHFGLAQVHLRRKVSPETTDRALSELQLALSLQAPEPAAVHYNLGLCYQRKQDWEASVKELAASLELAPDAWAAHYALADSLQKLGRTEEAQKARAKFALLRAKEDDRMKRSYHEQEVARNPLSAEARYQLASYLARQGDRRGAAKAVSAAASLAKSNDANSQLREKISRLAKELDGRRGSM